MTVPPSSLPNEDTPMLSSDLPIHGPYGGRYLSAHSKYGCIMADPPWSFAVRSDAGKGRSAERHYDTMTVNKIKALAPMLKGHSAKNCVLLLWVTDPMLDKAFEVITAWGFKYKTVGFYWAKQATPPLELVWDDKVAQVKPRWAMGTGYWTRANPEQCLLATRGTPHPQAHDVRRLIVAPRREHSRKPDEAYEAAAKLCSGPYLDMFARGQHDGWDTWGLEAYSGAAKPRWSSNTGPDTMHSPL